MVEAEVESSPQQKQVEEFWKARQKLFSLEDEQRICEAYTKHVLGAATFYEIGPIHAGIKQAKEDYASFYSEIKDILKPNREELEVLVSEGFDFAGLMCLLATPYGYSTARPAGQIICNMISNK